MKNEAALRFFGSIGLIFVYHYCQELLIEIALSVLDRYYDTHILKRVNFLRLFKDQKTKFIYSLFLGATSAYINTGLLRFNTK